MSKLNKILLVLLFICAGKSFAQFDLWGVSDPWRSVRKSGVSYTPTITIDTSTYPLTPYNNGYVILNGQSNKQFLRSRDLQHTEFMSSVTDSGSVTVRLAIDKRKAMWIVNKYSGAAGSWIIGFNSNTGNAVEAYHTATGWRTLRVLATTDTTMHVVKLAWDLVNDTWKGYFDDSLAFTVTGFTYTSANNDYAFTVGPQMPASYSDPTSGTGSPATHFPDVNIDYLNLHKWYNGTDSATVYNFNEGVGQMAYDSVTYLLIDATTPDGYRGGSHLCSGWNTGRDSQDVTWSRGIRKNTANAYAFGTGLWKWGEAVSPWYINSFTNGQCFYKGNYVFTAEFNTVNVTDGTWSYTGDTAKSMAMWNGSVWSKLGPNGSFFTGTVTQVHEHGTELFAGGDFANAGGLANGDYVARFDGTKWDTCAKGFDNACVAFTSYNGNLVAGGYFNNSGSTAIASSVASWNGTSWSAVGTGDIGVVWSLEVFNSVLYAGTANGLYWLNGSTWTLVTGTGYTIYCMEVHQNELWLGGIGFLAKWNGSAITSMGAMSGFESHAIEMASNGQDLFMAGSYYRIIYNGTNTVCNKIARWNGAAWSPLNYGADLRPEGINITNDSVIISGDFYSIDGVSIQNAGTITGQ